MNYPKTEQKLQNDKEIKAQKAVKKSLYLVWWFEYLPGKVSEQKHFAVYTL